MRIRCYIVLILGAGLWWLVQVRPSPLSTALWTESLPLASSRELPLISTTLPSTYPVDVEPKEVELITMLDKSKDEEAGATARDQLHRLASDLPQCLNCQSAYAESLLLQGEIEEAIAIYESVERLGFTSDGVLFRLADLYYLAGEDRKASELFQRRCLRRGIEERSDFDVLAAEAFERRVEGAVRD